MRCFLNLSCFALRLTKNKEKIALELKKSRINDSRLKQVCLLDGNVDQLEFPLPSDFPSPLNTADYNIYLFLIGQS